ncbi:MAG TPA: family 16 glycoside hydrolase, partial [Pirellulales bacterium]|nr:family 16 glycoside hydrolase [Pirellulales bacterium]
PYHKWLGIPRAEQPPHYYRLLGVALFEADADVIDSAADQRMAHVRSFQTGRHSADSQRILNELAAARRCLLDARQRATYDDGLRLRFDEAEPLHAVIPAAVGISQHAVGLATVEPIPFVADRPVRPVRKSRGLSSRSLAWLILAFVAVPTFAWIGYMIAQAKAARKPSVPVVEAPTPEQEQPPATETPTPNRIIGSPVDSSKRFAFAFEIPEHRGHWSIEGDELVQRSMEPEVTIVFGDPAWEEFDFSVEEKRIEGNEACGLRFRYVDPRNYDRFEVSGWGNSRHSIASVDQGKHEVLASREGSLQAGVWHKLEVRVRGLEGKCFLDGEALMNSELKRRGKGRLALYTWSPYRFRNIVVKTPGGKVLLEGLPALGGGPTTKPQETEDAQGLAKRTGGALPTDADGRPLNLGFETGDLKDWTAEGEAFAGQPVEGDTVFARQADMRSRHAGRFWISGYERAGDQPQGTLTSVPFQVRQPYASFLVGGGSDQNTCVQIVRKDSGKIVYQASGEAAESLKPVAVDLREHLGNDIFIRLVDANSGGWGHISFDGFLFHEAEPSFVPPHAGAAAGKLGGDAPSASPAPAKANDKPATPVSRMKEDAPAVKPAVTPREVAQLKHHTGAVTRVVFHRDLPSLVSTGRDGRVVVWNLEKQNTRTELHKFGWEVWAAKFSPDGALLAFADRQNGESEVLFKSVADGHEVHAIKDFNGTRRWAVASLAFSPDGRLFATGQDDGTIRLWDLPANTEFKPLPLGSAAVSLAFGRVTLDKKRKPAGYMLAAGSSEGLVRTMDVTFAKDKTATVLRSFAPTNVTFDGKDRVECVRFSPDGELLAVTRHGGHINLYDWRTGQSTREMPFTGGDVTWIAFHPQPQQPWCITAHRNERMACIWNYETKELLCELKGHTDGGLCAEFSPDGRRVATASEDYSIKLWELSGDGMPPAAAKKAVRRKGALPTLKVGE